MRVWVPTIEIEFENGDKRNKAFRPFLDMVDAMAFWPEKVPGVNLILPLFDAVTFEGRVMSATCFHENYSDDCPVCEMWLVANTITDEKESESDAHSG